MLTRLFSSKTRTDVLRLFFTRLDAKLYVREIAREVRRDISGIKRELDNLEKAGILISEKVGNLRYYQVNPACPIFPELRAIVGKTVGARASLHDALRRVKGVRTAVLYSTNAHDPGEGPSSMDLLVVGEMDLAELNEAINDLERRLGREISYLAFDEAEFARRRQEEDPFLTEVLKGRNVVLLGRADEL
jgi:hypothetical protein